MEREPRILIVENDWVVANGLREMLRNDGFRVVGIATKAEQVREMRDAHEPNLALAEINLGRGGDGIEVARDLLFPRGVRVVFASALADAATLARARGAAGFIVKPFTQRQLRAAVEMAIGLHDAPRSADAEVVVAHLEAARRALADLGVAIGASPASELAPEVAVRLRGDAQLAALSAREHEVLRGLLEHRRVPAIAEHLGISAHTVRNHLKAVFAKLRVSSQQELLDRVIDRAATEIEGER